MCFTTNDSHNLSTIVSYMLPDLWIFDIISYILLRNLPYGYRPNPYSTCELLVHFNMLLNVPVQCWASCGCHSFLLWILADMNYEWYATFSPLVNFELFIWYASSAEVLFYSISCSLLNEQSINSSLSGIILFLICDSLTGFSTVISLYGYEEPQTLTHNLMYS